MGLLTRRNQNRANYWAPLVREAETGDEALTAAIRYLRSTLRRIAESNRDDAERRRRGLADQLLIHAIQLDGAKDPKTL
jgi:hypothetical protein